VKERNLKTQGYEVNAGDTHGQRGPCCKKDAVRIDGVSIENNQNRLNLRNLPRIHVDCI